MIELEPPDAQALEAAIGRLRCAPGPVRHSSRRFYDTFDGLVRAAGSAVVHEDGRLVLLDVRSGEERAALSRPRPEQPLLADELEPGELRAALEKIIDVRALLPLVDVGSSLRAFSVLDDERKTVVRMQLEEPGVVSASGLRKPLRPRLRLVAVRGYEPELDRLREALGFPPMITSLVDEALRASGREPGGVSSKPGVRLAFDQRADAASVAVLRRLLEVIDVNLEGTIADTDTEFLHDFRVAVRRTRSVQREMRRVFPPAELERFRAEFRWLQQATGEARDLDVYVLEFDSFRAMVPAEMRSDLDPLLTVLKGRRLSARREMVRALRADRFAVLRADWAAFLEELVELPEEERPSASTPIGRMAGERITRVYRRMVKMGGAIGRDSPAEDYHELRKKGKELRYLLELFGAPLYPAEVVKPMIKSLKALQDVLGRHQDREVQVATLRSWRDEVSALPGGPGALMAMGVLVERLEADQLTARGEFASRFEDFAARRQRKLVKDTFA